jgi:hypothetical protein
MIAPLVLALALGADDWWVPPVSPVLRPGHFGQIDVHLDVGEPFEVDAAGTHNSGRGMFGVGAGYWLPGWFEGGLELHVGSLVPAGLQPVGVDWIQALIAKGFAPSEGWLFSTGLLLGFYNNSFSLFPDAGLRLRGTYEFQGHFDVGLAVTADTAIARVHDPIFLNVEGTFGFSFR